jgi:hypothetical protein
MSDKQKALAEAHGTPDQFERAVWAAWAQLFLTTSEAERAISDYYQRWVKAA